MGWSRAKANKFYKENALVIANTLFQQHKRGDTWKEWDLLAEEWFCLDIDDLI